MDEDVSLLRRLPVYLLFDCSRSMIGEPISAMEMGLRTLLADLHDDPVCLESVWISIITFNSVVELLLPLSDIDNLDIPDMEADGTTSLGAAIEFVSQRIDEEVRHTTESQKGDWKPMVFIFTDGEPTDDWEEEAEHLHNSGKALIIACGAGPEIDDSVLNKVGHHAIRLHDTKPGTLTEFMQWVSVSITSHSNSVGVSDTSEEELPPPPKEAVLIP